MAKRTRPQPDAYQIKIVLRGSKPPIWRRFVVPADIRLDALHDVIQIVMGWYDCHLHAFVIDNKQYTATSKDGQPLDIEGFDERKYRLEELLPSAKAKFRYEYDFGDGWEHVLEIEKIVPAAEGAKTLVCLAGRGRCPLEDCGAIWGYYRMLEILKDPAHPEYAEIEEWTGGKIDPDKFDLEAVNGALGGIASGGFSRRASFPVQDCLLYSGHQQQIQRCGVVVHGHNNDAPVARDCQILRMTDVVTASIGGSDAKWLERLFFPQSLNLLNRHAEIVARKPGVQKLRIWGCGHILWHDGRTPTPALPLGTWGGEKGGSLPQNMGTPGFGKAGT